MKPPSMNSEPVPVGAGLERLLKHMGAPGASVLNTIFQQWESVVGEAISANAKPARIKDSTLIVEVTDPAWAAELKWMRRDLITKLHAATNDTSISDIRFQVVRPDA